MNIQKLSKEQKINLLSALATGKITSEQIANLKHLDTCFVEVQTKNPWSYSVGGERVDEDQYRARLEISKAILGKSVVHIKIVHKE